MHPCAPRCLAGACFIDLETISAWHGKCAFYDERNYHWLKQPFSPEACPRWRGTSRRACAR